MGSFFLFLVAAGFLIWLFTLISHLGSRDFNDTDRIVWTIVLCTLNILGVVLYWFMAGKELDKAGRFRVKTEAELKEYFNTRDDKKGD